MTNADYKNRWHNVRTHGATITMERKRSIRAWMLEAIKPVQDKVRSFSKGHKLTADEREEIRNLLDGSTLYKNTRNEIDKALQALTEHAVQIDIEYIQEAIRESGAGIALPSDKIKRMYRAFAKAQVSRNAGTFTVLKNEAWSFTTGTNFSSRVLKASLSRSIWTNVSFMEDMILDVVQGGLSQGRDGASIATDLQAYILDGKKVIAGRWGKLTPDSQAYYDRLGEEIDYRALRLVRSEMYSGIQAAAVKAGEMNPACIGQYDWVLQAGRIGWPCSCPRLASGGPYKANEIPEYPHPSCSCILRPVLMDHDTFINNLKDYVNGVDTPGANKITEWAKTLDGE